MKWSFRLSESTSHATSFPIPQQTSAGAGSSLVSNMAAFGATAAFTVHLRQQRSFVCPSKADGQEISNRRAGNRERRMKGQERHAGAPLAPVMCGTRASEAGDQRRRVRHVTTITLHERRAGGGGGEGGGVSSRQRGDASI